MNKEEALDCIETIVDLYTKDILDDNHTVEAIIKVVKGMKPIKETAMEKVINEIPKIDFSFHKKAGRPKKPTIDFSFYDEAKPIPMKLSNADYFKEAIKNWNAKNKTNKIIPFEYTAKPKKAGRSKKEFSFHKKAGRPKLRQYTKILNVLKSIKRKKNGNQIGELAGIKKSGNYYKLLKRVAKENNLQNKIKQGR